MQAIWDQQNCYSVAITTLEGRMQTGFDDINARFDDLTTRFEALGLCANMNMGKREVNAENDARGQLVIKPICANPHGQYDYEYSSNDEDLFWLM